MQDVSTGQMFYKDNFADDRANREVEKYGYRPPLAEMAALPNIVGQHSIEPAYGNYDRPINESE